MSLEQPLLEATSRPDELVGRQKEMETLEAAIYEPGRECRLVLIGWPGGFGKTRLLEEVQRRMGHAGARGLYGDLAKSQDNWRERYKDRALVSDLLDVTDIRLHTRDAFLATLGHRRAWENKISFTRHESAQNKRRQLAQGGMALRRVIEASKDAEDTFWIELKKAGETRRLVILIDTLEQLSDHSSVWLIEHGLLKPEDIIFSTQQWLLDQIRQDRFENTTLVIAGREKEAAAYFDYLRRAVNDREESNTLCKLIELPPRKFPHQFTLAETHEYFKALEKSWGKRKENLAEDVHQAVQHLLKNPDQIQRLHHYSKGQPIRLALYTDILIQGETIPEPLMPTGDPLQDMGEDGAISDEVQQEIEAVFIDLLFSQDNLRSQILRHLVRATRGLTARQLHFILDSKNNDAAATWEDNPERVKAIQTEIDNMRRLAIIKPKPFGRVGLQDEVYRIYATQMSRPERKEVEAQARLYLYQQLLAWLKPQRERKQAERNRLIADRLSKIAVERPQKILNTSLPNQTEIKKQEFSQLVSEIRNLDLEFLHYSLLVAPYQHFNDTYYDFIDSKNKTQNEQVNAMFRAEMWRTLNDPYLTPFMDITKIQNKRGENALVVLRRVAQQNDAAEWILRFTMRGELDRAIELAEAIETVVQQLPHPWEQKSWSHTFAQGERACWREYAHIFKGKEIDKAVDRLIKVAQGLEKLAEADVNTLVFSDKQEYGFRGHSGYARLIYILAITYNTIGYGLATYGDFREAVRYYSLALQHMRAFPLAAQRSTTLNNLSRALVEMGRTGAVRICEDGLDFRLKEGELATIASSYNTLGLIYNDLHRADDALNACATALAIARDIDENEQERNTGLILIQLGEALRRIIRERPHKEEVPDVIYREAERVIHKAKDIFAVGPAGKQESPRLVEAQIEMGCLYRDWMARTDETRLHDSWVLRRDDALYYLDQAVKGSQKLGLVRLEFDAQVNMAWTYYYARDWEVAEKALQRSESLLPQKARLCSEQPPPLTKEHPSYIFHQASKLYGLYGRIAFDRFSEQVQKVREKYPDQKKDRQQYVHGNAEIQAQLQNAAKSYVQALGYAQLFTPRSPVLAVIYDGLYANLKKLNTTELKDFYRYARQANQEFRIAEIQLENLGDIEGFLGEDFGNYFTPPKSLADLFEGALDSE
jgi:hypothetical protein